MTDIAAESSTLDAIREDFRRLSRELLDAGQQVGTRADDVGSGTGELADALAEGLATFRLSWSLALAATSDTAGNIAANVGQFHLDLEAVDRASS